MKKSFLIILNLLGLTFAAHAKVEVLLNEPFSNNFGEFTLDEQKYPNCTYSSMWYIDQNYQYAKITANTAGVSKGASDCKLISPVIDTKGYDHLQLRFEHTTYAGNNTTDVDYLMVKVSKDGYSWTKIDIPTWPNQRWKFVECTIDLSAYASNQMQFMFEYVSTDTYAGTWEIKNVILEGTIEEDTPCLYNELKGLTSAALRERLHATTKSHTVLSYNQVRGDKAKVDVRSDGTLWDIYSDYNFNLSDYCTGIEYVEGECYNREHALPKSWWGGSQDEPMYTDLHHIFSTDAYANEMRSAWVYDEVTSVNWSNNLGSKRGTGSTWNETSFEPVDEYKGDLARVYFYMLTCYMDKDFTAGGKGFRYFTYNNGICNFQSKALTLMLKWHRADPVSERETIRNEKVAQLQGNANPFVKQPALVEYIWGTMKGKPYDCDEDIVEPDSGNVEGAITCQEARDKALALPKGTESTEEYVVVGYVTSLNGSYSTEYSSQSFWVADIPNGGNIFYAFQCYNKEPVVLGDKISLSGKLLNYNGTPEMKWGQTQILLRNGVENVKTGVLDWRHEHVEIYSLTGHKLSALREHLPQGIYVLRHGAEVEKIIIP